MMDQCPMLSRLSRFLFAAVVASGPGLTEAIFPWRQVPVDDARSYHTSVLADANKAIVAEVAVRHPLYVRIWANQGDHLKVRAVQRATIGEDVLEDVFRTSLVLVAPVNTTSRETQGLRDYGSDEMIEDQFHRPPASLYGSDEMIKDQSHRPPAAQVFRYRVWNPPKDPKSIVNPFLPRADALVAETEYLAQVSGWHFWIVADLQHTTRRCQIRNEGKFARSSPEHIKKCAANVAIMAELSGNGFGFWDLVAFPHIAAQVHRWEGINVATIVLPAAVVAVGAVFVQHKVCQRWIRHGESLLLGFLVCDAILWISVAMYCGTAAHRVAMGMVFIGRGLLSFLDFLVILLLTLAQMVFCSVCCASWAYLRCNLTWPVHRRALLMSSSLASFMCFGAGTFAGPTLGILASVLPLNFLTTHLPVQLFVALFCQCMDILCCGCLVRKRPPVTKIDLPPQTDHKVVLVAPQSSPRKLQDDSLPHKFQDDSLPHKPVLVEEEAEDTDQVATDSLSPPDGATAEDKAESPTCKSEVLSPDGDPLRGLLEKWTATCKSPAGVAHDLSEDMTCNDEGATISNPALPERPRPPGGAGLRLAPLGAGDLDPLAGINSSPGLSHSSQDMSPQSPLAFAPGFVGSRPMGVPPPPKRPPPGHYSARSLSPPAPPSTPPPNNRMPRLTPPGTPTGPSPPPSRSRPSPIRSQAQALGPSSPASSSSSSPRDAGRRTQDHHSPLASPSTTTATSISDSLTKGRPGPIRLEPLPKQVAKPKTKSLSESVGRRRRKLGKSPPAMTGTATSDSDSDCVSGVNSKGATPPQQAASPTLKPLSKNADRRRRKLAKSPSAPTGTATSDSDSDRVIGVHSKSETPPQEVASPKLKPLSKSAERRRRKLAKSPPEVTGKETDSDNDSASITHARELEPSQQANAMPKAVNESTGRRKRNLGKSTLRSAGTVASDSDSDLGRDIARKGAASHANETSEEGFQPPGRKQAFPGLMNVGASPAEPVSRGSTGTSVEGLGATNTSLELGASASNFMSPAKLLANAVPSGDFHVPGPPWTRTDERSTPQEAPCAPLPSALASLPQRLANLPPRPTSASVSSGGLPVEQPRSNDWGPPESGARTPPRQSPQDATVMSGPPSEGLLLRQPNMELRRLPPLENTRSDDACPPEAGIRTPPRRSSHDIGAGGRPGPEGLLLRQPNMMAGRTSTASSLPLEHPIPEDWCPEESGSRTPLCQSPRTTGSSWSQNVPMLRCPVVFQKESSQPCEVGTRRDDDWCPPPSGARTPPRSSRSGVRTPTRFSGTPRETASDWSPAASRATSRGGTPTASRRGTPTPSRSVTPRASQTPMTGEELRQLRLNLPQRRCSTPPQVLTPPSQHSFNMPFEHRRSM